MKRLIAVLVLAAVAGNAQAQRPAVRVDTVLVQHDHGKRCVCNDWELVRFQNGNALDTLRTGYQNRYNDPTVDSLRARYFWMWSTRKAVR